MSAAAPFWRYEENLLKSSGMPIEVLVGTQQG